MGRKPFRQATLVCLLAVAPAIAQHRMIPPDPTQWRVWSHREATAPRAYVDPVVTRSGRGSLVLAGASKTQVHGGWEHTVAGVEPGAWYRFSAVYRAQGVAYPTWQIAPRLDWLDAAGKRTGQPDYVYRTKDEPGGWTRAWLEVPAPPKAASVTLQLFLSHAPGGTVWWDEVRFEPIAQPAARTVRVASMNLRPDRQPSREANVELFIESLEKAAPGALDLILFPEGMTVVGTGKSYVEVAEPVPGGPTIRRLGELARARRAWVAAGIYETEGDAVYNTAVLIDRQGRLAGKYRKVYLPREEYERGLAPGNEFPVFDTDFGRIGLMICYDVFFTDPAKALAAQGAEVVLLPIWGGDETLAKARAIENRIFLVASGYDHPTYIMDPNGERIAQAARGSAAIATIDLNRRYTDQWLGDMRARRMKEQRTDVPVPAPRVE